MGMEEEAAAVCHPQQVGQGMFQLGGGAREGGTMLLLLLFFLLKKKKIKLTRRMGVGFAKKGQAADRGQVRDEMQPGRVEPMLAG